MKPSAYFISVVLLAIGTLAQDAAKQPSKDTSLGKTSPVTRAPLSNDELASLSGEDDTCYTIRAYLFRPSEDGGIEPAGMTTCVKSTQRALKRAQKRPVQAGPDVRLVH